MSGSLPPGVTQADIDRAIEEPEPPFTLWIWRCMDCKYTYRRETHDFSGSLIERSDGLCGPCLRKREEADPEPETEVSF